MVYLTQAASDRFDSEHLRTTASEYVYPELAFLSVKAFKAHVVMVCVQEFHLTPNLTPETENIIHFETHLEVPCSKIETSSLMKRLNRAKQWAVLAPGNKLARYLAPFARYWLPQNSRTPATNFEKVRNYTIFCRELTLFCTFPQFHEKNSVTFCAIPNFSNIILASTNIAAAYFLCHSSSHATFVI